MREARRPGNYPCHTILHMLMFQDVIDNNIMMKGIANLGRTRIERKGLGNGTSSRVQ